MVDLVKRLMFRTLTQAKEYPPLLLNASKAEVNDHEKGVPVYSYTTIKVGLFHLR